MRDFRLLILGGTAEARELAGALAGRPGLSVVTSLAGRTRRPARPAGDVRIGGFGGPRGLARYLAEEAIDGVIDATHPFAARISANAAAACARAGAPRAALSRPPWTPAAGDRWFPARDPDAAVARAAALGKRIFLAIGRQELAALRLPAGRAFVARVFEPPAAAPPPGVEIVVARGPFGEADETAFLRRRRIDAAVARNSGGAAGYGKIAAARALGLPIAMIERPPAPPAPRVASVAEAIASLEAWRAAA